MAERLLEGLVTWWSSVTCGPPRRRATRREESLSIRAHRRTGGDTGAKARLPFTARYW